METRTSNILPLDNNSFKVVDVKKLAIMLIYQIRRADDTLLCYPLLITLCKNKIYERIFFRPTMHTFVFVRVAAVSSLKKVASIMNECVLIKRKITSRMSDRQAG